MKFPQIGSLLLMASGLLFALDTPAIAQKKDYKPGEKIEWKSSGYPETWEEATFVKATPDGSQPIIREKPNQFNKDGYQRATSWSEIRPRGTKPNKASAVTDQDPTDKSTVETRKDLGTGLMTQAEVLSFLQTNMGEKPFQNPRREEIKKELAEMIKARGLDFRYSETSPEFFSKLGKYNGITSEVSFPLRDNYGAPTKQSWLMGSWKLGKIGAAVDYTKNDSVYRQGEIGVGNIGTLTLNANGTYIWKSATATSINGKWRGATGAEMRSQGGDGIVLIKAKSGYDWIVTKNRTTTVKGDWLSISELGTRQINEFGSRNGKK